MTFGVALIKSLEPSLHLCIGGESFSSVCMHMCMSYFQSVNTIVPKVLNEL